MKMKKMNGIVACLASAFLLISVACAERVQDYAFAQDRIWELEEKYGIQLLTGAEATVFNPEYGDLIVEEPTYEQPVLQHILGYEIDPEAEFLAVLDRLEEALGRYPEGFFARFQPALTVSLIGKSYYEGESGKFSGFFDDLSPEPHLYVDVNAIPRTFHHELWHAIEYTFGLEFPDWNDLNREGFVYGEQEYVNLYDYDEEYFYWYYSAMDEGEDRATVFEAYFLEDAEWWEEHPHLRMKLDVMLDIIEWRY